MDDDEAFNEYSRTLLSSRNIMYTILSLLEQQEQTLQRLAITAALRRASQSNETASIQNLVNHQIAEEPYIEDLRYNHQLELMLDLEILG